MVIRKKNDRRSVSIYRYMKNAFCRLPSGVCLLLVVVGCASNPESAPLWTARQGSAVNPPDDAMRVTLTFDDSLKDPGGRAETLSIVSHGIAPDAKCISMKTEWLERMLAEADSAGVVVRGVR